ncbi:unnamed protein product (mitochondrion) [Plasmodiophora brassicae]|uniref:proline--tRNA ligase n=1 Tax=Plasmodiophora brassicae TaxID=37360 RepID=A0A0G4IS66_PLABS|nr:hypothetical protein PBRA_006204 [Plasmodiophora brassicae]SPQ96091.1 unnamed protein product [Plasmodiophora brassicae]
MGAADANVQRLTETLSKFGLGPFQQVQHHAAVMTSADQVTALGSLPVSSVLAKNLVLKDKKKKIFLVVIEHDRELDLKVLPKQLPGATGPLRFVRGDEVEHLLAVPPGSVTPLAVINDQSNTAVVIVSAGIVKAQSVLVHPLINTATVQMPSADLLEFIKQSGNQLHVVDLDVIPTVAETTTQAPAPAAERAKKEVGATGIDIPKTSKTFGPWFSQVVSRSEMIDYYDISGCYILRPWSYFIWEEIQNYFNARIKKMGVKNSYFPLFVSEDALRKEKDHVEGFSAEVAWVTRAGKKDLEKAIAIRPTSETVMYPLMAKWIRSHRDLPLKLNQWSNVVRWEFKHPTPFIRSREFLWQEGHTAHATKDEAAKEVLEILDLYASVYEELLACPIIKGRKTEREKFAGADYTTTAEAFIPTNGRGVQGATSHCLGQNFSKMFKIVFQDDTKHDGAKHDDDTSHKQHVWQNSWGLTTRSIGVMVMIHGDDKGLVLPPRVAPVQVVFIPIYFSNADENQRINDAIDAYANALSEAGVRCETDLRTLYTPGWKYNHWELKGVPIRIEIGPQDLKKNQVTGCRRDSGRKFSLAHDNVVKGVMDMLETIQHDMLINAKAECDARIKKCMTWAEFMVLLNQGNRVLVPFCEEEQCEDQVKERSRVESESVEEDDDDSAAALADTGDFEKLTGSAKSLCIPFAQPDLPANSACFGCGQPAKSWTMFGRSY